MGCVINPPVAARSLTMADAETILRKLIEKILKKLNNNAPDITIRALTSGGANYTSTLYSATVELKNNEPLKLFAKVANVNEKIRQIMKVGTLFSTEDFVYTDLAKVYDKLEEKHCVPVEERFSFPKFYGSNLDEGEETVVLEDLVAKGYGMFSRFKSVDWEHMAAAVKALAKFHALSFAYRQEDPENFERTVERVKVVPETNDNPDIKETWSKMMGGAVEVVKEEYRERLLKFLTAESCKEDFYKFRMPLSTPVLCHGDYRISNLMFRTRSDNLEPLVLDYQILHPGSPVVDLLYLEFMGTDERFRRENHQRLLDYYYDQLTLAMRRLGVDSEVYSRETFDSEFKEMLPASLLITALILPLVTVEAERAPRLDGEADFKDMLLSPNQLFAERFRGIVNDCVRWGAL